MLQEAELFGVMWHYQVLKGQIQKTMVWAFASSKSWPHGLLLLVVSGLAQVLHMMVDNKLTLMTRKSGTTGCLHFRTVLLYWSNMTLR